MKALKEAASNFFERVRLAVQRRPSQAVRAQQTLKLPDRSGEIASQNGLVDRLWALRGEVRTTTDLPATHLKFLEDAGHNLSQQEIANLNSKVGDPAEYAALVFKLHAASLNESVKLENSSR